MYMILTSFALKVVLRVFQRYHFFCFFVNEMHNEINLSVTPESILFRLLGAPDVSESRLC